MARRVFERLRINLLTGVNGLPENWAVAYLSVAGGRRMGNTVDCMTLSDTSLKDPLRECTRNHIFE